jgi:hypothetical protein
MENIMRMGRLFCAFVVIVCSGCTGMEIGGKLWVSRVDERQESQRTHNVPLKCYLWADCSQQAEYENAK